MLGPANNRVHSLSLYILTIAEIQYNYIADILKITNMKSNIINSFAKFVFNNFANLKSIDSCCNIIYANSVLFKSLTV